MGSQTRLDGPARGGGSGSGWCRKHKWKRMLIETRAASPAAHRETTVCLVSFLSPETLLGAVAVTEVVVVVVVRRIPRNRVMQYNALEEVFLAVFWVSCWW